MNNVKIFVNEYPYNFELDIDYNIPQSYNFELSSIQNISVKTGGYSNTIELPATKNNDYAFGSLYDISSDFTIFNPNKKTSCVVIANGETVFNGVLKLVSYSDSKDYSRKGYRGVYKVQITENNLDIVGLMGENKLNDLDLSQFNHEYSKDNIESSWSHTNEDGYYYPIYYRNNNTYNVEDFVPAIYGWTYLDSIMREYGFGWTGSFKENERFKHEILPYSENGMPKYSDEDIEDSLYNVGCSSSISTLIGTFSTLYTDNFSGNNSLHDIPFDDDITNNHFNGGGYNTTLREYTSPISANMNFHVEYGIDFSLYCEDYSTANPIIEPTGNNNTGGIGGTYSPQLRVRTDVRKNGVSIYYVDNDIELISFEGLPSGEGVAASMGRLDISFDTNPLQINSNDVITVDYTINVVPSTNPSSFETTVYYESNGFESPVELSSEIVNDTDYVFYNIIPQQELSEGGTVNINSFLSTIKQKEFIDDLIKRYNLFIFSDLDNPKLFHFEPRPDFYNNNVIHNWNNKKDTSFRDIIQFIPDMQNREILFTYSDGDDVDNKAYKDQTNEVYGQHRYIFDNDYSKGVKTIKSIYSPTLNRPNFQSNNGNFIVPNIYTGNRKTKQRLLLAYGNYNLTSGNWKMNYDGGNQQATYNYYPLSLTVDNPLEPSIDLQWGRPLYRLTTYDMVRSTNNTQYNVYWSDYVRNLSKGKLVTMRFNLTPNDISKLRRNFGAKIFVDNNYYYINKIKEYNPLVNGLTEVELIYINDGVKFIPTEEKEVIDVVKPKPIVSGGVFVDSLVSGYSNVNLPYTWTLGDDNEVSSKNGEASPTLTIGSNNKNKQGVILLSDDSNVNGKSVIISGDNVDVIGDNITSIGSSDIKLYGNDKIFLGNKVYIDKETGVISTSGDVIVTNDIINGGENEVINISKTNFIDIINGGVDSVRNFGGDSKERPIINGNKM